MPWRPLAVVPGQVAAELVVPTSIAMLTSIAMSTSIAALAMVVPLSLVPLPLVRQPTERQQCADTSPIHRATKLRATAAPVLVIGGDGPAESSFRS